eukprot:scaffold47638_cov30-Tisochrysis_lutea.AAC.1
MQAIPLRWPCLDPLNGLSIPSQLACLLVHARRDVVRDPLLPRLLTCGEGWHAALSDEAPPC